MDQIVTEIYIKSEDSVRRKKGVSQNTNEIRTQNPTKVLNLYTFLETKFSPISFPLIIYSTNLQSTLSLFVRRDSRLILFIQD